MRAEIRHEHALRQRSGPVRADVIDGEHASGAGAEDGDHLVADAEGAAQADGQVIEAPESIRRKAEP